jgi:hypothetical protein
MKTVAVTLHPDVIDLLDDLLQDPAYTLDDIVNAALLDWFQGAGPAVSRAMRAVAQFSGSAQALDTR